MRLTLFIYILLAIVLLSGLTVAQDAAPTDRNYQVVSPTIDEECNNGLCSRRIYSTPQYVNYDGRWQKFTDAGTFTYDTLGFFTFNAGGRKVDFDIFGIYLGQVVYFKDLPPLITNQILPLAFIDKTKLLKFWLSANSIPGLTAIGFRLRDSQNCKPVNYGYVCGDLQIDFSDLQGQPTYTFQRQDTITPNGTISRQVIKSITYNKTITQNRTHLWVNLHSGLNVLDPQVFITGTNSTGNRGIYKVRTYDIRDNNIWNNTFKISSGLGYREFGFIAINATAAMPSNVILQNATLFIFSTSGATGPGAATMKIMAIACNQTSEQSNSVDSCTQLRVLNYSLTPKINWNKLTNMSYVVNQSYNGHTNPATKPIGKHTNISIWYQNGFNTVPVANITFNRLGTQREPYLELWYRQQSQAPRLYQCTQFSSALDDALGLNFTFYDEINRSRFNITKFTATFSVKDVNNLTAKINTSLTVTNSPRYVAFCIHPANHTLKVNATIKYEKAGFNYRSFYMHSAKDNVTSKTQNISLYSLQATKATLISLLVTDSLDAPLKDIITEVQKYFIGNNSFVTIGMTKSGEDGQDAIYLQQNEIDYRFILYQYGKIVKTTTGQKITAATYTIKIVPSSLSDLIVNVGSLITNLTYNNHTKTFRFGYFDPNSKIAGACLQSSIANRTGTYFKVANCSYGTFRGFLHSRPGNSTPSTVNGFGYIIMNGSTLNFGKKVLSVSQGLFVDKSKWGLYGIFLVMMLIVGLALTQVESPTSTMVMLMVVLFSTWWMGILSLTTGGIMALLILIGITIKELRTG